MNGQLTPREDAWHSLFHAFTPAKSEGTFARKTGSQRAFSFFGGNDLSAALDLAAEFDRLAGKQTPPDQVALGDVMERFHEVAQKNKLLAQWALRLFIAGRPGANILPMPTLRQQLAVLRTQRREEFSAVIDARALVAPVPHPEDLMAYYRHDIDLSDHHLHWHILYPFQKPKRGLQGRLFLFMHQQMLARYNTERFAAGLPPVEPFLQWDDQTTWQAAFSQTNIPADPLAPWIGPAWMKAPDAQYIAFDEAGSSPAANDPANLNYAVQGLGHVVSTLKAGSYATYDEVGADLEASNSNPAFAAGPHNMGHVVLSAPPSMPDPPPTDQSYFVMYSPEVAMTTPVFYRWHRVIDDIGFAWQESQGFDRTVYKTPPVTIRRGPATAPTHSPDIIITPRSAIPEADTAGFDLPAWAEQNFGGGHFDAAAPSALNFDELVTQLKEDPAIAGMQVLSLQTDWIYSIRINNSADVDSSITVRIWLAAQDLSTDRRNWIEMDKFVATVPAETKKVVARGSWQSSVVRAKSVTDPMMLADTSDTYDDTGDEHQAMWCECGLPYRLLLPRGTAIGMPARFLVLLTDAEEDQTRTQLGDADCGSVTFCAKQNNVWPDSKEMGFPFHRPFAAATNPVFAHFDPMPNVAWRDITIRAT